MDLEIARPSIYPSTGAREGGEREERREGGGEVTEGVSEWGERRSLGKREMRRWEMKKGDKRGRMVGRVRKIGGIRERDWQEREGKKGG